VLRRIRRRSLAVLRKEVEPVDAAAFGRFVPAWQGAERPRGGVDALTDALTRLQGAAIPASILEREVLPARVQGFRAADLDALTASGDLVWIGCGALGADDGTGHAAVPRSGGGARAHAGCRCAERAAA
jgi:ATP-dependent Lhr-like helicase